MRSNFRGKAVWIGPVGPVSVILRLHVVLINVPLTNTGNESFPNPCRAGLHRIGRYFPVIEIAYDRNALRIGGPDSQLNSPLPIPFRKVRAKFLICAVEGAFGKQISIEFA